MALALRARAIRKMYIIFIFTLLILSGGPPLSFDSLNLFIADS